MPASIERRRRALEEMRFADRMVGSVIGTAQRLSRQQGLDAMGGPGGGTDGFFSEHDSADSQAASTQILEAQHAFKHAMDLMGFESEERLVELERWGIAADFLDGIFDLFALMRAEENLSRARQLHGQILIVFERVRQSDPELAKSVPSLSDWETGIDDVWKANWKFNRSQMVAYALRFGIPIVVVAVFGYLQFFGDPFDLETREDTDTVETTEPAQPEEPAEFEKEPALPTAVMPGPLGCASADPSECRISCARDSECQIYVADVDDDGTAEWLFLHPSFDESGNSVVVLEMAKEFPKQAIFETAGPPQAIQGLPLGRPPTLGRKPNRGFRPICVTVSRDQEDVEVCRVWRGGAWIGAE
jgi:hypothetical protein